MSALGLIETKGLIAAIESADAMLKAADVRLLERNQIGAGLVTITIAGEVAAVKASIDAAAAAVKRISGADLISQHVIPRPDVELDNIILTKIVKEEPVIPEPEIIPENVDESADTDNAVNSIEDTTEDTEEVKTADSAKDLVESSKEDEIAEPEEVKEQVEEKVQEIKEVKKGYADSQLKKMNLSRLRGIARDLKNIDLGGKEVKSARKKELIEAIINAYRKEEE